MFDLIKEKTKNIGSLVLFLNNPKNRLYLDLINYSVPSGISGESLVVKIWYYVNEIKEVLVCGCGSPLKFRGFKNGFRKTCGLESCVISSRKETNIRIYGVDNPKKSKKVIEREQEKIKEKWGEHYMKNSDVRDKFQKTMIENHGVEWAQQSETIKEKSVNSWMENPDRPQIITKRAEKNRSKTDGEKKIIDLKKKDTISKKWGDYETFINHRNEQIREKSFEKYGVDHHLSSDAVILKRIESYKKNITDKIVSLIGDKYRYVDRKSNINRTDIIITLFCNQCQKEFEINRQYLRLRHDLKETICLVCNPKLSGKSHMEQEVVEFISQYMKVESNYKIGRTEVDIYLPDVKIGFEFNGLYWHSEVYKDSRFHISKTEKLSESGISLFHIWEDDWVFRKEIVKSQILSRISKIPERIYARNCEVREISDNRIVRDFLDKNHVQGFVGSKHKIGLFENDRLVSIMTFGGLRKVFNQKSEGGKFELLRFCNVLNTTVVGGATKMIQFFIRNHNPSEIISYCDVSRSNGNVYRKMGFELSHTSDPNYSWVISGVRKHRFNFRKDKLVNLGFDKSKTEIEIMHELGYYRIFDCGVQKWVLRRINETK